MQVLRTPFASAAQVSLSAFAFLFSELVQYNQSRVSSVTELERKCVRNRALLVGVALRQLSAVYPCCRRLDEAGYEVGSRVLEVLVARERANRRDTRLQGALQFIHTNVWRSLFGRVRRHAHLVRVHTHADVWLRCAHAQPADSLEIYKDDEYIIGDRDLLVNRCAHM